MGVLVESPKVELGVLEDGSWVLTTEEEGFRAHLRVTQDTEYGLDKVGFLVEKDGFIWNAIPNEGWNDIEGDLGKETVKLESLQRKLGIDLNKVLGELLKRWEAVNLIVKPVMMKVMGESDD